MKTTIMPTIILIFAIISSCSKENIQPDISKVVCNEDSIESFEMKNYLIMEYGFSECLIEETEDQFVVEDDICFPKENFWDNYMQKQDTGVHLKKHYRTPNLVTKVKTIEINVDSKVPSKWKSAFKTAVSKWNGLKGKITFKIVEGYCPAYGINVSYSSLGRNNTIAQSTFPSTKGYPGLFITINSQCNSSLTTSKIIFTAVHEMGHSIGLAHTDISSGYGQIITGLSSCDRNADTYSVMRSYVDAFTDFSACDKEAFRKLYPK